MSGASTEGVGPGPAAIRVVIIDDHRMVADSVAAALESSNDISVVGISETCADGLATVRRTQPDVLLLDQRLPDGMGTDLLPCLLDVSPATRVLLVTGSANDEVLRRALEGGCAGFLTKAERASTLISAVRSAAAGEAVLSVRDFDRLIARTNRPTRIGSDLTRRERDVLALLAAGHTNASIALSLSVAPTTARNYIQSVITKLGAHSKLEAVTIAQRQNIVGTE